MKKQLPQRVRIGSRLRLPEIPCVIFGGDVAKTYFGLRGADAQLHRPKNVGCAGFVSGTATAALQLGRDPVNELSPFPGRHRTDCRSGKAV